MIGAGCFLVWLSGTPSYSPILASVIHVGYRIATAINLHLPFTTKPRNEQHAREMLNRTRTWLACFNLDRSFGSQYGKPPIINNTDYTANHCAEWWHSSPYNLPNFDIHIACYSNELRVMADFGLKIRSDRNNPTGFNKVRLVTWHSGSFD